MGSGGEKNDFRNFMEISVFKMLENNYIHKQITIWENV